MTVEEAKDLIEERKQLELKIHNIEKQEVSDMNVATLFGRLAKLNALYQMHKQLSDRIKMVSKLA